MAHSLLFFTKFKDFGGTQKTILMLVEALRARGHFCTVVVSGEGVLTQKLRQSGIPFHVGAWQAHRLQDWVEACRFLRSQKWDAVFMHHNRLFSLLCRACGIPVIQRVNVPTSLAVRRWGTLPGVDRFFLGFTDHFIAPSRFVQKELQDQGIPAFKISLISNGIEPVSCTPVFRESLGLKANHFVIGSVGRLEPVKGHDLLLKAFHRLAKKIPEARLVLIGSGSQESFLKSRVREQGMESLVFFLPHQDDVSGHYSLFDLLVLPSRAEALANVLLEAALCECPLLASNRGGNGDFVEHEKTGVLVDPENTVALVNAIQDCYNHRAPWKAYAVAARRKAQTEFTVESMAQKTIQAIENVLRSKITT